MIGSIAQSIGNGTSTIAQSIGNGTSTIAQSIGSGTSTIAQSIGSGTSTIIKGGAMIPNNIANIVGGVVNNKDKKIRPPSTRSEVVEQLLACCNRRDAGERYLELHHPKCRFFYHEAVIMGLDEHVECVKNIFESFPDFHIYMVDHCDPNERSDGGRTFVVNVVASGTHTGKPYGYGPLPRIPATGVRCVNDPERMFIEIDDLKIRNVKIVALGRFCGPPGFYDQTNGTLRAHQSPTQKVAKATIGRNNYIVNEGHPKSPKSPAQTGAKQTIGNSSSSSSSLFSICPPYKKSAVSN